mmetsp:Transcript_11562/g.23302  ORF Transcript_11562/g.23302 Transcript_11562/m.23302 type:complete len:227 (-) Transcript_11562:193-873(-)
MLERCRKSFASSWATLSSSRRRRSLVFSLRNAVISIVLRSSLSCISASLVVTCSLILRSRSASALTPLNHSSISCILSTSAASRCMASCSSNCSGSAWEGPTAPSRFICPLLAATPLSSTPASDGAPTTGCASISYAAMRICVVGAAPLADGSIAIRPSSVSKSTSSLVTSSSIEPASIALNLVVRSSRLPYSVRYVWSGCSSPSEWMSLSLWSVWSIRSIPSRLG